MHFFVYNLTVSPDGLLKQSSTVADLAFFTFAEGTTEYIPCSYIEFVERLLLPQFKDFQDKEVFIIYYDCIDLLLTPFSSPT